MTPLQRILAGMLVLLGLSITILACSPTVATSPTIIAVTQIVTAAPMPSVTGHGTQAPQPTSTPEPVIREPLRLEASQTWAALKAQGTQYINSEYPYDDQGYYLWLTLVAGTAQNTTPTLTPTVTPLPFVMPRTPTPQAGVVVDPYWLNLYYDGNNPTPEEKAFLDELYYDCYQRYWEFISFQDGPPGPDFAERLAEYQWTDGDNGLYDPRVPQYGADIAIVPQYSSYQLTVQYVQWLLDKGYYVRQSLVNANQKRLLWGGFVNSSNDPNREDANNVVLRGPNPPDGRYEMLFDVNQQSDGRNPVRSELVRITDGQVVFESTMHSPNSITICEWDPVTNEWKLAVAALEFYNQVRFMDYFPALSSAVTPERPWTATPKP